MSQYIKSGNYTDVLEKHPLYQTWRWMIRMGVRFNVCEEWKNDLIQFHKDMGDRPSKKHQLYRKNKELGYSKENCIWKELKGDFCKSGYMKEWRKENPEKCKNNDLLKMHKITLEEYNTLLKKQNGVCAICGNPEYVTMADGKPRNLAVDHNHETGKIRGLLCTNCNKGLGHFKDNIEKLKIAINYLES